MKPHWQHFDNGKIAKLSGGRHLAWPDGMHIDAARRFSTFTEAGIFLDRMHELREQVKYR